MTFSTEIQSFKIGRMTYGLPSFIDKGTSLVLVYEHESNPDEIVFVSDCEVSQIYYSGTWMPNSKYLGSTVISVVDKMENYWRDNNISI